MVLGRRRKGTDLPLTNDELIEAAGEIVDKAYMILDALLDIQERGKRDDNS